MLESLKKNESFTYKKLSAEEMAARKILGRLVGPCADFNNHTRNGRKYSEALWEKVFSDEIVLEKINSKCLFGEFGHPLDREEVNPDRIAIALPEVPKKNADGKLEACFDILDTPSGRILKTVCDYGAHIGISSRGSGDIIEEYGEELVDPETYYFECFDAVLLPAVKQARLEYMHESVDTNMLRMKKSLKEELERASEEDKKIMQDTLESLNIKLTEEEALLTNPDDIPYEPIDEESDLLVEDSEEEVEETEGDVEETESEVEEAEDEVEEVEEAEEANSEESEITLVKDFIEELQKLDENLPIEFKEFELEGKIYDLSLEVIEGDEKIELGVICEPKEADSENTENLPAEEIEAGEFVVEEEPIEAEEQSEKASEPTEEAEDSGEEDEVDAEMLESLKEVIRQKALYEAEVKSLKNEKTVSDAKVEKLEKDINRYKESFIRVSKVAADKSRFEKEAESLTEQLAQKNDEVKTLKIQTAKARKVIESLQKELNQVKVLTEQLNAVKAENEKLTKQVSSTNQKLVESNAIAKNAKAKCSAILNKYIESKATMLGVNPKEITNRLNESYTLTDIDHICEDLLSYNVKMNNLPFGVKRNTARVVESKQPVKQAPKIDGGYEIDDSLLELAGLK